MPRAHSTRVLVWACLALVAVAVAVWGGLAIAQQPSSAGAGSAAAPRTAGSAGSRAEAPAETPVPEDAKPKKKEFRGRLPAYYSRVVDEKQRQKIYAIQREYAPKIDALKAQLAALTAERDEKVVAVLTPEQLKTIQQLKAEAEAKRAAAKAAKSGSE
jgi:hypothetical protein